MEQAADLASYVELSSDDGPDNESASHDGSVLDVGSDDDDSSLTPVLTRQSSAPFMMSVNA
jgi:hypothetical protein